MGDKKESETVSQQKLDGDGRRLRVVVIGGSIAGLSCAQALLKTGFCSVTVLEKATKLTSAGAGLGIDELSFKALEDWDLGDDQFSPICLPLDSERTRAVDFASVTIVDLSADEENRHKALHWSDLHHVLYNALPPGIVHLGHEVVDLKESEDGSSIRVSVSVTGAEKDQPKTNEDITADLLLAADGSMSFVRQRYSQSEHKRYSGYCAWRGVLDYTDEPEVIDAVRKYFPDIGKTLYFELAPGTHSVLYELAGNRLNWLWYINQPEPELKGNSVTMHPDAETIDRMHDEANRTWVPGLAKLMKETPKPFINAIYDRDPLKQFVWGRVVLVGEAGHPTTPHALRSTNMSIVDAHVLGKALEKWGTDNVDAALAEYNSTRLPTTTQEVLFSRYLGQLKQGRTFDPGFFPWPHADTKMKDRLLIRNMHSNDWNDDSVYSF